MATRTRNVIMVGARVDRVLPAAEMGTVLAQLAQEPGDEEGAEAVP